MYYYIVGLRLSILKHIAESVFMLVRLVGFIFNVVSIYEKVGTLSIIPCPYQLSKYRPMQRIYLIRRFQFDALLYDFS